MAWILSLATFEGERVNTIPRGTDQILVPVTQIKNRFFSPFRTLIYAQSFILKEFQPMKFIPYINWVTGLLTTLTWVLPASRFYRSSALCGRWSTASDNPLFFLFCLSLFGKTQHKLELLRPGLKTRDLLFLSNTTPRVTLLVTLVGTFSDLLRENSVRNGGVFPPSLHGVQRMPFPKCRLRHHLQQCLTWERPRQKQCPLLSYFLELLS